MTAALLANQMERAGFRVRLWKEKRVYVYGYGKDVSCYIEPRSSTVVTADQAQIVVSSNWRSPHVGLRCKGVKHALLSDLYRARLLSNAPPADWRAVILEDRSPPQRMIMSMEQPLTMDWPL